jgi:peptidoglycan L-alanyl-D-glutamate endopeptidase CwlK
MPQFSRRSKQRLDTCHPDLIRWAKKLIESYDFTVLCGYRDQHDQTEAFRLNRTTKRWPYSLHNKKPSTAIDLAPYPVDWYDKTRFAFFAGYAISIAEQLGIELRWGADWDRDRYSRDERLIDMPHFELVIKRPTIA